MTDALLSKTIIWLLGFWKLNVFGLGVSFLIVRVVRRLERGGSS